MESLRRIETDDKQRLLELLKRAELLRTSCVPVRGAKPLVICHHPQLPETAPEELEVARIGGRPILHLRVERAPEGWLLARVQREQKPYLVWSSEDNAPMTLETVYRMDVGSKTAEMVAARYGRGCHVDYTGESL
jgi:hypothetical protein